MVAHGEIGGLGVNAPAISWGSGGHDGSMEVQVLRLADGRSLAWREFGDPDGAPAIAVHGSPDSSAVWRLVDQPARAAKVRVVAPDRPGFGASTPQGSRSILDWVDDLDALTTHLRLDRFGLIAISGGSPYALAVASSHAEQVTHLGLLSVICPLDVPGVLRRAKTQVRFTFWAARRAPFLLGPMSRAMARMTLENPDKAAERLIGMRPPADREIIRRPEVMAVLKENLPNQFKDEASMALEMRNAARPWGFELGGIEVPTTIWQGGLDDVHPPAMGHYLAEHLPRAELVFEPEYATFNFIDDFEEILRSLTAGER
jgi:pimeloyl-ACP methyl ester carboxylesterase